MATLTNGEKTEIRQACALEMTVDYTKTQLNAALQAVETWVDDPATRSAVGAVIETAAPGVFTNAEKKKIARWVLRRKFNAGE